MYLGTVSLDYNSAHSTRPNNILPAELTSKLISYERLGRLKRKTYREDDMLALKAFELFYPFFCEEKGAVFSSGDDLEDNMLPTRVRMEDVFSNGMVKRFPDGKAYFFEPLYLYPNVYKMIIFSHKAISNYRDSIDARYNGEN